MAVLKLASCFDLLASRRCVRTLIVVVPALVFLLLLLMSTSFLQDHGIARDILPLLGKGGDEPNPPEFYPFLTVSPFFPVSLDDVANKSTEDLCASFPSHLLAGRVQPVLKIGHSDLGPKLDAQLGSVSACFAPDELLVVSDLDEDHLPGGHRAVDVLADLPDSYRSPDNPDFESYFAMRHMRRQGILDSDPVVAASLNGWRLDRFKFLPMVERAWAARPHRDWYVFYETDTYVVWDNMFRFLSTLDPSTPQYLGSPSPGRVVEPAPGDGRQTGRAGSAYKVEEGGADGKKIKTFFANGGPGYVLSRAAVEKLLARRADPATGRFLDPPLATRAFDDIRRDCCGDSVLGYLLWRAGVAIGGYWPLFNPHSLHGVPYSDAYWCQPVLTMHKTTPEDMVALWRWEHGRRQKDTPLLYRDLFEFRHPGRPARLQNWDNGDWARFAPPKDMRIDSADACAKACEAYHDCAQWLWRGLDVRECVLMRQIRYGVERAPETLPRSEDDHNDDKKEDDVKQKVDFTSGWMTARIDRWKEEHRCDVIQWVGPSITRIF